MDRNIHRLNVKISKVVIQAAIAYANYSIDLNPLNEEDNGFRYYFLEYLKDFRKSLDDEQTLAWVKGVY